MKTFLKFFLITLFILGCENDKGEAITDGAVYTELNVRYDKTTNRTTGTAWFWQGNKNGRWLIFNPDATLEFQDNAMAYRPGDHSYFKELENLQTPAVFSFTDINNKVFVNSIDVKQIDFRPADDLDTIDTSQPLTVTWSGTVLENSEIVTLRIESISATQDSIGTSTVTFTNEKFSLLSGFKNSTVLMTIERSRSIALQQDLGGNGFIRAEYISQSKNVYLK
ncbi:MAG: hypothetical protein HYV29_10735 [Ignavibacteriales bacterium]|nr:hypothetical protein [Ignavibacteriales bacterium]